METPLGTTLSERSEGRLDGKNPTILKGIIKPVEVAAMISFLLCDESRFVTKSVYKLDGGCLG